MTNGWIAAQLNASDTRHLMPSTPATCHTRCMVRTWLSVSVELLGGRGESFWPYPGRIFAVGPSHTFAALADAINVAFARWDMAHLAEFTLSDGTGITQLEYNEEPTGITGPITVPLDMATTKVSRTVKAGDEFRFIFDFGDQWVHRCVVEPSKVDPMEVLGIRPKTPLAYWGWGNMPDQYGRRWIDDDGESRTPRRPAQEHPMVHSLWPPADTLPALNKAEVQQAIEAEDASWFVSAILNRNIDDELHTLAAGAPLLLEHRSEEHLNIVMALINRLSFRRGPGDQELADQLIAQLRG